MAEIKLSSHQIEDAAGVFAETVQAATDRVLYQPSERAVPCPGYDTAASLFGLDSKMPEFPVAPGDQRLGALGGLRVRVGVHSRDRKLVYLPGIVLPDTHNDVRIGCLSGPDIVRDTQAQLTDLQQVLLEQVAAMHMPGVGEHAQNRQVNVGDIGHAALIAITAPEATPGIHGRVHAFVGSGLSQSVAKTGALSIARGHDTRVVSEVIVPAAQAAQIIIPRHYQVPASLGLSASEAAVGVTLAAVRSQGSSYRQPDLARNAAAVVAQYA